MLAELHATMSSIFLCLMHSPLTRLPALQAARLCAEDKEENGHYRRKRHAVYLALLVLSSRRCADHCLVVDRALPLLAIPTMGMGASGGKMGTLKVKILILGR